MRRSAELLTAVLLLGAAVVSRPLAIEAQGPSAEVPITVERVEGRAMFTEEMSLRDIRAKALTQALNAAVTEALGRRLTAMTEVTTMEAGESVVSETFTEIVREAAGGIVTRHDILEESWVSGQPFTPGAVYQVAVRASVRKDPAASRPSFSFAARANQSRFVDRGIPERSDEVVLTVDTSDDVFLTVFVVTDDSAQVIFPNVFMPRIQVRAGVPTEVPSQGQRMQAGIRLRVELPANVATRTERLVVVGTKQFVPYRGVAERRSTEDAAEVPLIRATLDAVVSWLLDIPASERAIADVAYQIIRESK